MFFWNSLALSMIQGGIKNIQNHIENFRLLSSFLMEKRLRPRQPALRLTGNGFYVYRYLSHHGYQNVSEYSHTICDKLERPKLQFLAECLAYRISKASSSLATQSSGRSFLLLYPPSPPIFILSQLSSTQSFFKPWFVSPLHWSLSDSPK